MVAVVKSAVNIPAGSTCVGCRTATTSLAVEPSRSSPPVNVPSTVTLAKPDVTVEFPATPSEFCVSVRTASSLVTVIVPACPLACSIHAFNEVAALIAVLDLKNSLEVTSSTSLAVYV